MAHSLPKSDPGEAELERLLVDAFLQNGWRVHAKPPGNEESDLIVVKGKTRYAVVLRKASEGRKDRLIPLLAQAVLEAQAAVRGESHQQTVPLAVVVAPRFSESLLPEVRKFADRYAPGVAVGIVDQEGFRAFAGAGLDSLNARRSKPRMLVSAPAPSSHMFSDLNQWMLKVLLAPRIPENMIAAPRREYRNVSQVARAAGVSVMSAFRFVRQLKNECFLDDSDDALKLVRVPELMRRWNAANLRPVQEIPMRFIIRGSESQFHDSLRSYAREREESLRHSRRSFPCNLPRLCLGLFAAADVLKAGFVYGAPLHLYMERLNNDVIERLGLQPAQAGQPPDLYIRAPWTPESIFRAVVEHEGMPVCDILQVWLDVSSHPARGSAQADHIRKRLLAPLFEGSR
jgi:hypothetical protein